MTLETARRLRTSVQGAYSAAAEKPADGHAFPVGERFAREVGYPRELLDRLPRASVERFAGVSNVAVFAEIAEGNAVLDLGCGAGLDSFAASGRVIGIDFSESMLRDRSRGRAPKRTIRAYRSRRPPRRICRWRTARWMLHS